MPYRRLGSTGLEVSALGFGCMSFGGKERWFGGVGDQEAARLVGYALDHGVNFFDTADVYNVGQSEEMLGKALGKRRREALIATKVFCRMGQGPNQDGLSRQHILDACDASLKRLGADHIDLYQPHEFDARTPLEESLRAFEDLVRWGKVRYLGCSNFSGAELRQSLDLAAAKGWTRFESNQVQYSLLQRGAEADQLALVRERGVSILAWSPLAGGYLSGKYKKGAPFTRGFPFFEPARAAAVVSVLEKVAAMQNMSPAQAALAWVLSRPWVASAIIGVTSQAQLEENLAASSRSLSKDALSYLDRL